MTFGEKIKMMLIEAAIPGAVGLGTDALHDIFIKMADKQPKRFAITMQSLYPPFKGVLQPLCKSTKTKIDDKVCDPLVVLLEDIMTEKNIPIPVVVPIDFDAIEDIPEEEVQPAA